MAAIFQELWDADQSGNGVPAVRPGEATDPNRGFVVVDERPGNVSSNHTVFPSVSIPERKMETYRLCQRLFDNYALERSARERIDIVESQEEFDFIDAILGTPPIETARQFLELSLDRKISRDVMAAMIKETWFEMGRAGSQDDASGFEHVFVGEQSSKASKIGGYHFWYKYHLDDGGAGVDGAAGEDRISYRGTRYSGAEEPDKGVLVPEVVTLSLAWDAPGGDGSSGRTLQKPIGGFFVGISPEGMIAQGLVRARTQSAKITRINGAEYQLDLHRLDGRPTAIRTFFPRFRKADVQAIERPVPSEPTPRPDAPEPEPGPGPEVPVTAAPGAFRVVAAMVNPPNPEGGREFLQLLNTTGALQSLNNWQVVAPNGTAFVLADTAVAPGEVFKFIVPSSEGILRNRGGVILLKDPAGAVVQSCAYGADEGRAEGRPVVF